MVSRNKKIGLLGVPLGFGAAQIGSELGVNAIRHSRIRGRTLVEHIADLGYQVIDHGDAEIVRPTERAKSDDNPKYLPEMVASCRNIFAAVQRVFESGDLPVILGGEHSIALATYPAVDSMSDGPCGLIWFDAHADMNTPQTSPTGNIHGMPLATIFGRGEPRLIEIGGKENRLDPQYFAHVGARDLDVGERSLISDLGLREHFFTMSDIDRRGMPDCMSDALDIVSQAPGGFAVTFDIDMIDPRFAPGSGTLVRGGATYREAHLALEMIAERGGMRSFEIVEVNPMLDQSNITVELACELILSALGKTII